MEKQNALSMEQGGAVRPWYKEFWAWLVLAPLIVVIIACAITVSIAFRVADDRVDDNYFKDGRAISRNFSADTQAKHLGLKARIQLLGPGNDQSLAEAEGQMGARVLVDLNQPIDAQKVELSFSHPVDEQRDFHLQLSAQSPLKFIASLPLEQLYGSRWYVRLVEREQIFAPGVEADFPGSRSTDEIWRLSGELKKIEAPLALNHSAERLKAEPFSYELLLD